MNYFVSLGTTLLAACAAVGVSHAATVERGFIQNGGSACTGALPTFEGALRKRPKAIANEGTSAAFVTCSAVSNDRNSARPRAAYLYVTNRSAAPANLSCTLVNGDDYYGSTATPQTLSIPVNSLTLMRWSPVSPATQFQYNAVSISCALPPGVEIDLFGQIIDQDVGA